MDVRTAIKRGNPVTLTFYDDRLPAETAETLTPDLAALIAYADAWARQQSRSDSATLTFSSTLAAMVAGDHPLSQWLRLRLALRGTAAEAVTKGLVFQGLVLPTGRLTTTYSFRRALAKAKELAATRLLDVKHLMAAFPVVKAYHSGDFLRYRIDRRAWCLALADRLQQTEPAAEREEWVDYAAQAPTVLLPRYRPDLPAGADLLGVGREVEAFAMLLASARTSMPLSIGVFGAWGSGKSYFMARLEERVSTLARGGHSSGPYLQHIAHVRFNAWHYSEGDVVASLVDQIFRNLRYGPEDSALDLSNRRAAAVGQVAAADAEVRDMQRRVDDAAAVESQLREEWRRVNAEHDDRVARTNADLVTAQSSVATAEQELADALAAQEAAVAAARRAAPAHVAAGLVADTILAEPALAALDADLRRVAKEARWIGANRFTIGWGVVVVVLTPIAVSVAASAGGSSAVTTLAAAIAAVTPLAARAISVLRELAEKGSAFQAAVAERTDAAVAAVREQHRELLEGQERAVNGARVTVTALRARLDEAAEAARQAQAAHAASEAGRRQAAEELATAAATAAAARQKLAGVTLGSLLGDTIQEAADTDVFRQRLGTLSYARGYFQRLSETMHAARKESRATGADAPVLERIVLYIDDLDRCPGDKVRAVLQAVHLLLAFDLFACVVAVDPRWILECLDGSPGVIGRRRRDRGRDDDHPVDAERLPDPDPSGDTDLDVLGGVTTSSDYLEKIFQIPLWLRPLPPEQRAALAATLFAPDPDQSDEITFAVDRGVQASDDNDTCETRAPRAGQSAPVGDRPAPLPLEVQINAGEIDFLQRRVAPLLNGNARALKRFVNTYYLVKSALPEVEFDEFAPKSLDTDDARRDAYRVCMAQLALLATNRRRARVLARLVDDSPGVTRRLGEWLGGLRVGQTSEVASIADDLSAVLLPELEQLPVDRFAYWFERTRRYSFYL